MPQSHLSNQISCIYVAQNHNHLASVGFTICTVNNILSLEPWLEWGKTCHIEPFNRGKKKGWKKPQEKPQRRMLLFWVVLKATECVLSFLLMSLLSLSDCGMFSIAHCSQVLLSFRYWWNCNGATVVAAAAYKDVKVPFLQSGLKYV